MSRAYSIPSIRAHGLGHVLFVCGGSTTRQSRCGGLLGLRCRRSGSGRFVLTQTLIVGLGLGLGRSSYGSGRRSVALVAVLGAAFGAPSCEWRWWRAEKDIFWYLLWRDDLIDACIVGGHTRNDDNAWNIHGSSCSFCGGADYCSCFFKFVGTLCETRWNFLPFFPKLLKGEIWNSRSVSMHILHSFCMQLKLLPGLNKWRASKEQLKEPMITEKVCSKRPKEYSLVMKP